MAKLTSLILIFFQDIIDSMEDISSSYVIKQARMKKFNSVSILCPVEVNFRDGDILCTVKILNIGTCMSEQTV